MRNAILPVIICCFLAFTACQKENSKGITDLKVHLTDNPFNATEVNVDIREVKVKMNDDNWSDLSINSGIYNLLTYQNGVDTLLAHGVVPTGRLQEIRFVLGDANSITIDNVTYPLTIPSGSESGLKLKIDRDLQPALDSLIIDFDAAMSILQTGTGDYKLKPVLRIK